MVTTGPVSMLAGKKEASGDSFRTCRHCGIVGETGEEMKLLMCKRCKEIYYYSTDRQKSQKHHKNVCRIKSGKGR